MMQSGIGSIRFRATGEATFDFEPAGQAKLSTAYLAKGTTAARFGWRYGAQSHYLAAIHSLGLTEVAPARREADATLSVI
jgi:hypothetical protein